MKKDKIQLYFAMPSSSFDEEIDDDFINVKYARDHFGEKKVLITQDGLTIALDKKDLSGLTYMLCALELNLKKLKE